MCGIAGIFSMDGDAVDGAELRAMRDAVRHRGPDDEGLWLRPGRADVGLGHRRLSIVDLSPLGRQPMANEDGSVVVTFNGEIYNHAELRAGLERRGHRFRSQCDTEVLVHLYEDHGPDLVEQLVGMFAFALWDEAGERLVLARDRLGIKPLYWSASERRFAFGSEIKSLMPLVARRDVDPDALAQYLTFVAVPPPRTLFAGIQKLPPASVMIVDRDGVRPPRRFWDPLAERENGPVEDWQGEVRRRLETSVRRRMMSDVPVGIFLSGGVDSSTNVALMSQLVDEPVNTFSVGYRDAPEYDELDWARRVAEQFGTRHREVILDEDDLWSFVPRMVHHQDEPIADPVCVPLFYVSRLAKESGVTVVHVGEGADEVFAGYPTYVTAYRMAMGPWKRLRSLPLRVRAVLGAAGATAARVVPRWEIHGEALARVRDPHAQLWWGGAVAFYERAFDRLTTPSFRASLNGGRPASVIAEIAADADRFGASDELTRIIYQDLRIRLPELLLMRVDKLSMANAIEARVPFLDHELVELAMSIPPEQKVVDGVGKVVLKRAVADLLPEDLLWRPKQGFGAPVARWFRGSLAERVRERILASDIHQLGAFDPAQVEALIAIHRRGRADRSFQLWNILNLSVWFDHWIAGRTGESALTHR